MPELIIPDWPVPPGVRALSTTRGGGCSEPPWASFNLGDHVGDAPSAVAANRALLNAELPAEPMWLRQVHGTRCVDATRAIAGVEADASFTRSRGVVCAVMTADCLPVLVCAGDGSVVGIAHAGWRGLAAGVIESLLAAMQVPGELLIAWFGPAIGPLAFEVGSEVRETFLAHDPEAQKGFVEQTDGKWLADIYLLARQRLGALGVRRIYGGGLCTVNDDQRFFSFRRDGITGRMASLVWIA